MNRSIRGTARRLAGGMAALAAGSLVLAACAQEPAGSDGDDGGDDAAGEGGDVELRFTWWGADARAQITEEVVAMFEEENPGITIETEWSTWDGYWDKLATGAAAGDMPDIVQMDESQINSYGTRGTLLDLESQDALDLSEITPEVLATGEVEGTVVGAPVGIALLSVGVNPDIIEQAGMEMPDDTTWTWDEFIETAAQISTELSDEGITGLDYFGLSSSDMAAFVRGHGQEIFPDDDDEPVTAETLTAYYEQVLRMVEEGAVPAPSVQSESLTLPIENQPFATNQSAFHLLFHTQIQAFVDASGTEHQLLRLPAVESGEPRMVNKASMYWSVAETTEHPEEAAMFVDFLLNDEEAAKVLGVERGVPGNPRIQELIKPELGPTGQMSVEFASDLQDEVVEPPQVTPSAAAEFGGEATRIGGEVLFGSTTPADAAEQVLGLIESYQE